MKLIELQNKHPEFFNNVNTYRSFWTIAPDSKIELKEPLGWLVIVSTEMGHGLFFISAAENLNPKSLLGWFENLNPLRIVAETMQEYCHWVCESCHRPISYPVDFCLTCASKRKH